MMAAEEAAEGSIPAGRLRWARGPRASAPAGTEPAAAEMTADTARWTAQPMGSAASRQVPPPAGEEPALLHYELGMIQEFTVV